MHKGDTIPGALVTAVGAFFLIATLTNSRLTIAPATSDGVPGAGFFPFVMGSILVVLGIVLILNGIRQKGAKTYLNITPETKRNLKILLLVVAGLVVFFIFWNLTHWFYPAIFLLSLYLNKIFERTWKFNIIYTAIFTAFIYLTFTLAFSIQFTI